MSVSRRGAPERTRDKRFLRGTLSWHELNAIVLNLATDRKI